MSAFQRLQFVEVLAVDRALSVSIDRAFARHIALRRNQHRVRRLVERQLSAFNATPLRHNQLRLPDEAGRREQLQSRLFRLDRKLADIASAPLGLAVVEQVLGISARERQHWTRDGRLRKHGSAYLQRGQLVAFSTYSSAQVDELLADPAALETWRLQDLQFGG